MTHNKEKQKKYYDQHTKELDPLNVGDIVRVKPVRGKSWPKAIVIEKLHERSYIVKQENRNTFRRNRRDLKKTEEKWNEEYTGMDMI